MLSAYGFLNLSLVLMNYLVVVAIFLELVVVAEWFELPHAKAAKMIVPVEIAESGLDLVEDL
jgi:hypothetical protein